MKKQLVLISFDLDSKRATPDSYEEALKAFKRFGLLPTCRNVSLPNTTVAGEMNVQDGATPESISDYFRGYFSVMPVPVTRFAVAFVDSAFYFSAA